jgi:hypothetical protein
VRATIPDTGAAAVCLLFDPVRCVAGGDEKDVIGFGLFRRRQHCDYDCVLRGFVANAMVFLTIFGFPVFVVQRWGVPRHFGTCRKKCGFSGIFWRSFGRFALRTD